MTTPAQDSMTDAITAKVMDAIQKRDHQLSEKLRQQKAEEYSLELTAKKAVSIKEGLVALGFFATLIGGGALTFAEMQAKPSTAEVERAIHLQVDPVRDRVAPVEESVEVLTGNVERMQQLQEMQMQHAEWRADVEDCRARKSCKKPPPEPQSLKDKKRALMTQK